MLHFFESGLQLLTTRAIKTDSVIASVDSEKLLVDQCFQYLPQNLFLIVVKVVSSTQEASLKLLVPHVTALTHY